MQEDRYNSNLEKFCKEFSLRLEEILEKKPTPYAESFSESEKLDEREILDFYARNIKISFLSEEYFLRSYEIDPSSAFRLMGSYLCSSTQLNEHKLGLLLEMRKNWSREDFEKSLPYFLEHVIPIILNLDLRGEIKKIGIEIEISLADDPYKPDDDFFIEINFSFEDKKITYTNEELKKRYLSDRAIREISICYDNERMRKPFEMNSFGILKAIQKLMNISGNVLHEERNGNL